MTGYEKATKARSENLSRADGVESRKQVLLPTCTLTSKNGSKRWTLTAVAARFSALHRAGRVSGVSAFGETFDEFARVGRVLSCGQEYRDLKIFIVASERGPSVESTVESLLV